MAFFLFLLSGIFAFFVIHPFITYPLSLLFLHRKKILYNNDEKNFSFAICMCAYNEEAVIKEKAENLLLLKKSIPNLKVFIYVDCASDKTAEILSKYADDFFIHVSPKRHGKTHGMNLLVKQTNAEIIVFTDANVMIDESSMSSLEKYFTDPKVGCVCGHLKYINADDGTTAATGSLYWKIEEKIKQMESDTGSVMGADGSIFAIRRSLHTPPPDDIIDDMFVSFSILCDGYRIVRAPDVIAFEKSVTSSSEEFNRKVRISCQAFNVHRLLWDKIKTLDSVNLYKYISHKLLRWFGFFWIVLSAFCFLSGLILAGLNTWAFYLSVSCVAIFGIGYLYKIKPMPQIVDIFSSYIATSYGVWKSIAGERFQTWSPAQSIRRKDSFK